MKRSRLPHDFATSAAYAVHAIDVHASRAQMLHFNADDYRRASFLDARALGHREIPRWIVSLDELGHAAPRDGAPVGPHLLFHLGHVGSTLVSRLLDLLPEVLGLREQDYVAGAVADGASDARILSRYILPNCLSPLIVQATVTIPEAIIGEAILSFLGLGVQPPTPSWGTMLSSAQAFLSQAPYLALFPGVAIVLATLSFNLLGDGLRDVLDPKSVR